MPRGGLTPRGPPTPRGAAGRQTPRGDRRGSPGSSSNESCATVDGPAAGGFGVANISGGRAAAAKAPAAAVTRERRASLDRAASGSGASVPGTSSRIPR